ncbi:MFS transporter [Duganella sp. FT80W]|uniref:MFS transporter n=2 Tax=Duganella guangzhouensis TaxID=2666084 RepID=A0A6I2L7F8_9BURK|nr:MFS transporter [Duganella guangzhouensis]
MDNVENNSQALSALYRKISWRLLPLLMLAYLVSYLDRVNIGYAKLQMLTALQFSDAVYGMGAGIFFVGYFLCEVPSNLLLEKIGARKTMLRIMVLWGAVAAGMMLVKTPAQFYIMRFLLGVFEAGFFPGVVLYLTYWFPAARRGKVLALFMTSTIAASLVAGPLCGAILQYLDGWRGLAGWQWMFVLQGVPALLLGVVLFLRLDDQPEQARWLSEAERELLRADLAQGAPAAPPPKVSLLAMLRSRVIYGYAMVNFLMIGATYALVFWVPSLIRSWGVQDALLIGLYAALPNLVGMIGMLLMARHSDKHGERRWHYAASVGIALAGIALTIAAQGVLLPSLIGMCIATVGVASTTPLFITFTTEALPRHLQAAGIGMITSIGILGGGASSAITGVLTHHGGPNAILAFVMLLFALSAALLLLVSRRRAD